MRTVKLVIAFDGTRYEGWQSQRKQNTIQEIFERILEQIFKEPTLVVSSSRTDSGVHAEGLVAHFKTRSKLPDNKLKDAINFYLPKDILVCQAKTVRADFHARFQAKSKIYRYDIWHDKTRPLFEAPYVFWYPHPLKIDLMKKAALRMKGRHDFAAFRDNGGDELKSTVRTIKRIAISKKKELLRIEVEGSGFLRHMIRIMVGTLLEVGRGKMRPSQISGILASKDRSKAGPTAKSQGLRLCKVKY